MSVSRNRERSSYWSFTYNLKIDEPLETAEIRKSELEQELCSLSWVDDAGFQLEKGLTTGRYHMQGWIKLDKRQYKSYLLNGFFNQGKYANCMHFERARNIGALVDYCCKSDATKVSEYWCKSDVIEDTKRREEEAKHHAVMEEFNKEYEAFQEWKQAECQKNGFVNNLCYCSEDETDTASYIPKCRCHLDPNLKGVFTQYWSQPLDN